MEYFEVTIHARVFDLVFVLLDFRVAVHFDAEVVSGLLPVDFAVCDGEEIFGAYFGAVRQL